MKLATWVEYRFFPSNYFYEDINLETCFKFKLFFNWKFCTIWPQHHQQRSSYTPVPLQQQTPTSNTTRSQQQRSSVDIPSPLQQQWSTYTPRPPQQQRSSYASLPLQQQGSTYALRLPQQQRSSCAPQISQKQWSNYTPWTLPQHQLQDSYHRQDPLHELQQYQSAEERRRLRRREKNKKSREAIKAMKALDAQLVSAGLETPLSRLRQDRS